MSPDPDASATGLDAAQFRLLARRILLQSAGPWSAYQPHPAGTPPSDFDLNPGAHADWRATESPRAAAVLVPVIARETLTLLFTQRTHDLPAHAGQIAFPGGKADPGDVTPVDTALREAAEEIGLPPHFAEPIGHLDRYRTGTGFEITPVIALIDPAFIPTPDSREVADVFEVPLKFLMDPGNHQRHTRTLAGRERHFYAMPFGERFIWGATAGILRNMQERLFVE